MCLGAKPHLSPACWVTLGEAPAFCGPQVVHPSSRFRHNGPWGWRNHLRNYPDFLEQRLPLDGMSKVLIPGYGDAV